MREISLLLLAMIIFVPSLHAKNKQIEILAQPVAETEQRTETDYINNLGMHFRLIPAGTFVMGSPDNEPGRDEDETQHTVTISRPFFMQTTEVTQGQWEAVMRTNKSHFSACGSDCPVERVSWEEAQDFINRLNKLTARRYRLPTEAEFEYAARAGTTDALANGKLTEIWCEEDEKMNEISWYCGNAQKKTHPVGQKKANPWGLHDMHGNLWEWCQDSWDGSAYSSESVTDPLGNKNTDGRVIRGGSWNDYAWHTRSANRDWCVYHYRNEFVGFRLVLTP